METESFEEHDAFLSQWLSGRWCFRDEEGDGSITISRDGNQLNLDLETGRQTEEITETAETSVTTRDAIYSRDASGRRLTRRGQNNSVYYTRCR